MNMTYFTDEWALLGTIDPAALASSPATATLTDAIDMASYDQVAFVVAVGAIGAAANTVNFSVTQAATSGGVYKAISGTAITPLTGSPTDANKQVIVTVDQTALDLANDYRYVKGSLSTAGGASTTLACVTVFGRAKHKPASGSDLASVDEIVNA